MKNAITDFVQVRHAVTCSSGTDALLMSLMAYETGPGDAVFTSPFTFIATAEVIKLLGATPVFVDIDPDTFNISTDRLKSSIKEVTKAGRLPWACRLHLIFSGKTPWMLWIRRCYIYRFR